MKPFLWVVLWCFLVFGPLRSDAQKLRSTESSPRDPFSWVVTAGLHCSKFNNAGELTVMRARSTQIMIVVEMLAYGAGVEYLKDNKADIWAPKACFEYDYTFLGFRFNLLDYIAKGNEHSLRLRPEIAFSILGAANVSYGYTIPLNNKDLVRIGSSLNVTINFFPGGRKWINDKGMLSRGGWFLPD